MAVTTDRALVEMMLTNTGAHMLDSGGAYGRGWERARAAVADYDDPLEYFLAQPHTTLEFSRIDAERGYECRPDVSHNTFHWLREQLGDYLEDETVAFWDWAGQPDQEDCGWPTLMEQWAAENDWSECTGSTPSVYNTYNGGSLVADVLQFCGDYEKVMLQIHRGCDVRGGYTPPRIFECFDGLWRVADGSIWAEPAEVEQQQSEKLLDVEPIILCPPRWWTDDGWNWYSDEGADNLHKYNMTDDETLRGAGFVYVDENRNGYCPVTGTLLRAGF